MKKLFTGVVVVTLLAVAYYFGSGVLLQTEKQVTGEPASGKISNAIRAKLGTFENGLGTKIDLLVPGEMAAYMTWNFRGALRDETAAKPFFGTIRSVCQAHQSPDCWELVALSVDGVSVFSEEAVPPTVPQSEVDVMERHSVASSSESAKIKEDDVVTSLQTASGDAGQQQPPVDDDEQAVTAVKPRQKSWYTRSANVNGRLGPGTEHEVAFKIPPDLALALIETSNDWGLFQYPAKNGKDGRIWIWMPLVEQP